MQRVYTLWYSFLSVWALTLLYYGAVAPWAVAATTATLAVLNLLAHFLLKERLKLSRAAIVFLSCLGGIFLIQLLPGLPFLFPVTHAYRERHGVGQLWPATADAFLTVRLLTQIGAYVLSALLVLRLRRAGLGAQEAMKGLLAVLALEALYGLVQSFAGLKNVPFFGPRLTPDSASGTLVNRNSFGGLMAMSLALAVGLAFMRFSWPPRKPDEDRRPRFPRRLEASGLWILLSSLFVVALVLSKSRGGALAALAGVALLPFLYRGRASIAGIASFGAVVAVAFVAANPAGLFARFTEIGALDADTRVQIVTATAGAALDQPVFGFGAGTHPHAFHPYQSPTLPGQVHHAHNEFVNAFFEGGAALLTLVVWGLGLWFLKVWRAQRSLPGTDRMPVTALLATASIVGLHALVDMDLRITSIGMFFGVVLALGASVSRTGSERGAWALSPSLAGLAASAVLLFLPLQTDRWITPMVDGQTPVDEAACARALGLSPHDYRPAWMHARAAQSRADLDLADRRFELAAELFPAHPDLQRDAGLWFWVRYVETNARTQHARAAACYRRLFVQQPQSVRPAIAQIWMASRPLGDFEALLPESPLTAAALASFLVEQGQWTSAADLFERRCPPVGANFAAYDYFAEALSRAGQWGLESQVREKRLGIRADGPAYLAAARAWSRLGVHEKALDLARTACLIDPINSDSFAVKASLEMALGKPAMAVETLTEGLQRPGASEALRRERGRILLSMKLYDAGVADLNSLWSTRRDDRGLTIELARALAAWGKTGEARILLDSYLATSPPDAEMMRIREGLK